MNLKYVILAYHQGQVLLNVVLSTFQKNVNVTLVHILNKTLNLIKM